MDNNMLSQEEIDALLGLNNFGEDDEEHQEKVTLTSEEKDALGEISNISMGTAATTLSSLVNHKVNITTPTVNVTNWDELGDKYQRPCVAIQVEYKEGLKGTNLMMLKEDDVKIITDLMMGGDGTNINKDEPLNDLHLSAICEAMNQMVGSSSTSLFSIFNKKIDIMPPVATVIDFDIKELPENFNEQVNKFLKGDFVQIQFNMVIGDIVDSAIMQLYPIDFAKELYNNLIQSQGLEQEAQPFLEPKVDKNMNKENKIDINSNVNNQQNAMNNNAVNMNNIPNMNNMQNNNNMQNLHRNVDVQPVQFQNFDMSSFVQQKENIDLIMDVPLEISVELGRTRKPIKEILEFTPGTVIELDKLAGEAIDILVNGKLVAKGEVVVIDEYFAIRVTDIVNRKIKL